MRRRKPMEEEPVRVQKLIANAGFCSRRKAEELILDKKVKVNGKLAMIGDCATSKDKILVNGQSLGQSSKVYIALNKPKGYITTKSDPENRRTIYDLPEIRKMNNPGLKAVGRLDMMSEGLLFMTTDGDFANKVTHPRYETEKVYEVRVEPLFAKEDIDLLEKGIMIEGKRTKIKAVLANRNVRLTIHEGRNRIIRKVMEKLDYKIYQLRRISIGRVRLGNLQTGKIRQLSGSEVKGFIGGPKKATNRKPVRRSTSTSSKVRKPKSPTKKRATWPKRRKKA